MLLPYPYEHTQSRFPPPLLPCQEAPSLPFPPLSSPSLPFASHTCKHEALSPGVGACLRVIVHHVPKALLG